MPRSAEPRNWKDPAVRAAYQKEYKQRRQLGLDTRIASKGTWGSGPARGAHYGGLTREEVAERVRLQGGCAVCRVQAPRGKRFWHVDHSHETGKIRGVLCITCNIALGMLHDDPERANRAAEYLARNK